MKFQKFVKALGSDGIVYNRKNGERWLASRQRQRSLFRKV